MQDNSLVTIICLCYNHEKYVVESLLSVINQEYPFIELIVVDDCSTDQSKEFISKWCLDFPEIQFIANPTNLGNTKSFNKALKLAKGNFIIDLAADDILLPNCVYLQIKTFKESKYKNLGIVYGNAELITENGKFDSFYFPVDSLKRTIEERQTGDIYLNVISNGNSICSISSMVKKTVLDDLKGYDENLAYEDLDLWIRAARSYEIDYIDAVIVQKRILDTSLTSSFFSKNNRKFKKINQSTYLILKKTLLLNVNKKEDLALKKRVHHEIVHTFKIKSYSLFCKNIGLRLWLFWRTSFKRY
ncbi:glycosyltransferase [Flavobacterium sp. Fl-77]|uniref:Glycosyltransferase n=1 Tax=Flavobacterium flavipigmentatum TaxID=2893884 RepID=A0AAJ2SEX5_9FLAO|nr:MULTISPECIES: glycosyltransferase [unclassified Flavobacterium]MDX6181902.1 glycosyltransferase [Flavobacterium sp. Fl-33]MDX6185064.1 glycosyltransferase [Flavobacterium sp. Fl-77]UFH37174.1 glycosyltransferase [Flavobacterium sp. F-70]